MIIPNGLLQVIMRTGGGIDPETGHARRPASSVYGEDIPCQILPKTYDALAVSNGGNYTLAEYEILIDERPFEAVAIRIENDKGQELGEYSVKEIEPLPAVYQIRIIV